MGGTTYIDIGGWLEAIGNPFKLTKVEQIGPAVAGGVTLAIIVAALLFLGWFIWGAIEWLTSEGKKESVQAARSKITNAFIGLVLVLAAYLVFAVVTYLFGIPIGTGK